MPESRVTATATSGGIGFVGLLTIAFTVLKLVGVINWSWIWVLAPMWISFLLSVAVIIFFFLVIAIIAIVNTKKR